MEKKSVVVWKIKQIKVPGNQFKLARVKMMQKLKVISICLVGKPQGFWGVPGKTQKQRVFGLSLSWSKNTFQIKNFQRELKKKRTNWSTYLVFRNTAKKRMVVKPLKSFEVFVFTYFFFFFWYNSFVSIKKTKRCCLMVKCQNFEWVKRPIWFSMK